MPQKNPVFFLTCFALLQNNCPHSDYGHPQIQKMSLSLPIELSPRVPYHPLLVSTVHWLLLVTLVPSSFFSLEEKKVGLGDVYLQQGGSIAVVDL
jgi:hypothetical protein